MNIQIFNSNEAAEDILLDWSPIVFQPPIVFQSIHCTGKKDTEAVTDITERYFVPSLELITFAGDHIGSIV